MVGTETEVTALWISAAGEKESEQMRLVLLGPPGAGKGTQAALLAAEWHVPAISTGDMFRQAVREQTELGRQAQRYMEAGQLVPDEVTIGIVAERLQQDDCNDGFILDGFPRTVAQSQALDAILARWDQSVQAVEFEISDDEVVRRIAGRRSCADCGAVYNLHTSPPAQEGRCDRCGGTLVQREDDQPDTVRARLAVYHAQTSPLTDYYLSSGRLLRIAATGSVAEVTDAVRVAVLGARG